MSEVPQSPLYDARSLMSELTTSDSETEYLSFPTSPEKSASSSRRQDHSEAHNASFKNNQRFLRAKGIFDSLPKNVFQFPGSAALWFDLAGHNLTEEQTSALRKKTSSLSSDEKYIFASMIASDGLDVALTKKVIVEEAVRVANLHPPASSQPRRFTNASVQVGEPGVKPTDQQTESDSV